VAPAASRRAFDTVAARFAPQRHSDCVAGRDRGRVTTAAVAFLGWRFAGLPIAAAIALARSCTTRCGRSQRGPAAFCAFRSESGSSCGARACLNDATALLIYRAAVAAAVGSFSLVGDAPILLLAAVGSLVAGYVLARLFMVATPYVRDAAGSTVLQFISTFGCWLLSERLTLSPIITVMVYA